MSETVEVVKEEHICCQCHNKFDSIANFYKTYSTLYTESKYLPICKDCFANVYNSYCERYNDREKAMQRMCMAFDLYWNENLFLSCCEEDSVGIGNYMKYLNMYQFQNKTFDNNLDKGFVFGEKSVSKVQRERLRLKRKKHANQEETKVEEIRPDETKAEEVKAEATKPQETKKEPQIRPVDIERWGSGFDVEEYKALNTHYKYLKAANPNCDSNQEIFIVNLCEIKMQQARALRDGDIDAYSKLTELYRKIFQQAGLKTVKEATTSAEDCWSSWTGIISKTTPEEYYSNKELYKDMDGFDDYMTRHYLRPLNNLVNSTEKRDSEFYIGDGAEDE